MSAVLEDSLIERLVKGFGRSPLQLNGLQESDSELLRLPNGAVVLAVTTDGIVEEIEQGLYDYPYQIGWMTITVNASDLAASAADPIGVLVNQTFPHAADEGLISEVQHGIRDACDCYSLALLGGDTNFSSVMQMSGVALGVVSADYALTRCGCQPGDRLFASAPLGLGSSYALTKLGRGYQDAGRGVSFLPRARLAESHLMRGYVSACMDTSDGMVATIDQLSRLNHVGFDVELPVREFLHPHAKLIAEEAGIPPWMMLAGPHGEFELLFTVPQGLCAAFTHLAKSQRWNPIEIGTVAAGSGLRLNDARQWLEIDTPRVRDLFFQPSDDIALYLAELPRLAHPVDSAKALVR
jgi:thiamine-monophosphate kinase